MAGLSELVVFGKFEIGGRVLRGVRAYAAFIGVMVIVPVTVGWVSGLQVCQNVGVCG